MFVSVGSLTSRDILNGNSNFAYFTKIDNLLQMSKQKIAYSNLMAEPLGDVLFASAYNAFGGELDLENESVHLVDVASVPVLLYHGISEEADRFTITPETFLEHMKSLNEAGYHAITLTQFEDFMAGDSYLPEKPVLITFDDGREDSYFGAHPLFERYNYSAVMFIATDQIAKSYDKNSHYYLSESQLLTMSSSGYWDIASHGRQELGGQIHIDDSGTMGNFLSNRLWLTEKMRNENLAEYILRLRRELWGSKSYIDNLLGVDTKTFSYPYGDFGQQTLNNQMAPVDIEHVLKSAGYLYGFRQIWDRDYSFSHNSATDDSFRLKRIEPATDWSGDELIQRLQAGEEKNLPIVLSDIGKYDLRSSWGLVSAGDEGIYLSATENTTGAMAVIDGTRHWNEYEVDVNAVLEAGSHFSILTNFIDANHYMACVFNASYTRVESVANGERTILLEVKNIDEETSYQNPEFEVVVDGDSVTCTHGDDVAAYSSDTDHSGLRTGGVGYKVWSKVPGVANITIADMSVRATSE